MEILVGILNLCSLVGLLLSDKISDLIGRLYTVVLNVPGRRNPDGIRTLAFVPHDWKNSCGHRADDRSRLRGRVLSPAMSRGLLLSLQEIFVTTGRRRAGECFGDFGKLGFRSDINNFLMILKK